MSDHAEKIATLNDTFREELFVGLAGGKVSGLYNITADLQATFGPEDLVSIFRKVASFDQFTPDNDPYGEHDFGSIEHGGEDIYWKIDYYDRESLAAGAEHGSEDPSDPEKTTRVLTVMLTREY